jgi:AraC-type DNA-binding domain-containing proteins
MRELGPPEGSAPSSVPGLELMRFDRSEGRHPVTYEPSIVIVAQGRKIGYLGDRRYVYDANNYLVLAAPMPFECEVVASPEEPFLGFSLRIDELELAELLADMGRLGPGAERGTAALPRCICATSLTEEMVDASVRLLSCLHSAEDSRMIGPGVVREIVYRVLCGPNGPMLEALVAQGGRFARIVRSLGRIHSDYSSSLDVEGLAQEAGMSVSAFHHAFKSVAATSPVQYIKSIRLQKARLFMMQDGLGAGEAAERVGYLSASQFSREYKRFFGRNPSEES